MQIIRLGCGLLLGLSLISVGAPPATAQAQTDTITLCGTALKLGLSKADTLDALAKRCAVKEMPNTEGHWCVSGQYACSHLIAFADNKLSFVQKDVGAADSNAGAEVLADFIADIEAMSGTPEATSTGTTHQSFAVVVTNTLITKDPTTQKDIILKHLSITIGQKTIEIQANRPVGGGNISLSPIAVTEMLSQPK